MTTSNAMDVDSIVYGDDVNHNFHPRGDFVGGSVGGVADGKLDPRLQLHDPKIPNFIPDSVPDTKIQDPNVPNPAETDWKQQLSNTWKGSWADINTYKKNTPKVQHVPKPTAPPDYSYKYYKSEYHPFSFHENRQHTKIMNHGKELFDAIGKIDNFDPNKIKLYKKDSVRPFADQTWSAVDDKYWKGEKPEQYDWTNGKFELRHDDAILKQINTHDPTRAWDILNIASMVGLGIIQPELIPAMAVGGAIGGIVGAATHDDILQSAILGGNVASVLAGGAIAAGKVASSSATVGLAKAIATNPVAFGEAIGTGTGSIGGSIYGGVKGKNWQAAAAGAMMGGVVGGGIGKVISKGVGKVVSGENVFHVEVKNNANIIQSEGKTPSTINSVNKNLQIKNTMPGKPYVHPQRILDEIKITDAEINSAAQLESKNGILPWDLPDVKAISDKLGLNAKDLFKNWVKLYKKAPLITGGVTGSIIGAGSQVVAGGDNDEIALGAIGGAAVGVGLSSVISGGPVYNKILNSLNKNPIYTGIGVGSVGGAGLAASTGGDRTDIVYGALQGGAYGGLAGLGAKSYIELKNVVGRPAANIATAAGAGAIVGPMMGASSFQGAVAAGTVAFTGEVAASTIRTYEQNVAASLEVESKIDTAMRHPLRYENLEADLKALQEAKRAIRNNQTWTGYVRSIYHDFVGKATGTSSYVSSDIHASQVRHIP